MARLKMAISRQQLIEAGCLEPSKRGRKLIYTPEEARVVKNQQQRDGQVVFRKRMQVAKEKYAELQRDKVGIEALIS